MRNYSKILLALGSAWLLFSGCERKSDSERAEPQTLEQGIKQAGNAIEHGAEKAGAALQHGVDQARPTVERGVDKMGQMIEHGAQKAVPALERGVKKLGHAIEQGVEKTGAELTAPAGEPSAEANFDGEASSKLDGEAKFYAHDGKVRIVVDVTGAPPGLHGIHIHEKGDCSDLKAMSMGAHFDPQGHHHGLPTSKAHHLGDLGNITIGDDGKGELEIAVPDATLAQDKPASFLGKSIVIHAGPDSGKGSAGKSGDPIACGVVKSS